MQAIHPQTDAGDKKKALYNLFAAYVHTVPLEELLASVERIGQPYRWVVVVGFCAMEGNFAAVNLQQLIFWQRNVNKKVWVILSSWHGG